MAGHNYIHLYWLSCATIRRVVQDTFMIYYFDSIANNVRDKNTNNKKSLNFILSFCMPSVEIKLSLIETNWTANDL